MISTRKEDTTSNHLPHDAPNRPNVHIFCVAHAKDYLEKEREKIQVCCKYLVLTKFKLNLLCLIRYMCILYTIQVTITFQS